MIKLYTHTGAACVFRKNWLVNNVIIERQKKLMFQFWIWIDSHVEIPIYILR